MITDSGVELLLAAIYRQALEDLEAAAARVVRMQQACGKGQLAKYIAENGLPLETEDDETIAQWYERGPRQPRELAEMVSLVNQYSRHCRLCAEAVRRRACG